MRVGRRGRRAEGRTGGLDNVVGASGAPRDLLRVHLVEDLDGLAVDDEVGAVNLDRAVEPAVDRVVLQHVRWTTNNWSVAVCACWLRAAAVPPPLPLAAAATALQRGAAARLRHGAAGTGQRAPMYSAGMNGSLMAVMTAPLESALRQTRRPMRPKPLMPTEMFRAGAADIWRASGRAVDLAANIAKRESEEKLGFDVDWFEGGKRHERDSGEVDAAKFTMRLAVCAIDRFDLPADLYFDKQVRSKVVLKKRRW